MGVAGFLGSHLAEELLKKGIQVIGVDNLSTGSRKNLENLSKDKHFHFINQSIDDQKFFRDVLSGLNLPRLDYAFFVAGFCNQQQLYSHGLMNFLNYIKNTKDTLSEQEKDKPRVAFVSSIDLYSRSRSNDFSHEYTEELTELKEGEIRFAKYVKYHKLNGRVIRLSPIFGPRMHFRVEDPVIKLIQSALADRLNDQNTSLDLASRAMYVEDVTHLIIKTVLSGSTSQKIYDGVPLSPVKVAEVKQILMDPIWHEMKGFKPSEMPPWLTPNLEKTMKELSWSSKTSMVKALKETIFYFKDHEIKVEVPIEEVKNHFSKKWSFSAYGETEEEKGPSEQKNIDEMPKKSGGLFPRLRSKSGGIFALIIILLGVVLPIGSLAYEGLSIRNYLKNAADEISKAEFDKAKGEVRQANNAVADMIKVVNSIAFLKGLGLEDQIESLEMLLKASKEGVEGVEKAVNGSEELYKARQVISGELDAPPMPFYEQAQAELTSASQKLSKVQSSLEESRYTPLIQERVDDLKIRLGLYSDLVDKARSASFLLPFITAVDGKRTYLVLLQDNTEMRGAGGGVKSYARLTFEKGRIAEVTVEDGEEINKKLQQPIAVPTELKNDLEVEELLFRDSNYEPDFPTSAKTAEIFLRRSDGINVQGVFALDLVGLSYLINALGGVNVDGFNQKVTGEDYIEKYLDKTKEGTNQKNFITSSSTALFNKLFYLSKHNWPQVVSAINRSLEEKHLLVYLADPALFAYAASENWSGILPRGVSDEGGSTNDFLSIIDSNASSNSSSYYLEKQINLDTEVTKNFEVVHSLKVSYSLSPQGQQLKNRVRVYLPLGTKITKATFGEADVTGSLSSYSEYVRAVYTALLTFSPGEKKVFTLSYQLNKPLSFKESSSLYKLDIFKQSGSKDDEFNWKVSYPINLRAESELAKSKNSEQEIILNTELSKDKSLQILFAK